MVCISKEIKIKFGANVQKYRLLAKLTQEKLAEVCECSKQTISGIETGYTFPKSNTLFNISKALNIPLMYLFDFGEDKEFFNNANTALINKYLSNMDKQKVDIVLKIIQTLAE